MRGSTVGLIALAAVSIVATAAKAQVHYEGPQGIYRYDAPAGWSQQNLGEEADAFFVGPGGASQGGMFSTLQKPRGTLEQEAQRAGEGMSVAFTRPMTVGGVPCISQQVSDGQKIENFFACKITVQFKEGPEVLLFSMGSSAPASNAAFVSDGYWRAVNTVQWGQGVGP